MQPLKRWNVLLGILAMLACSGDPTGNESIPTDIIVTTGGERVFVTQGDSQPVIASVVDEHGQIIESDINASNVGAGISVVEDPTYLPVNSGKPIARQHRFFVKGNDLAAATFTLEAFGLSKTVEVTSIPGDLRASISTLTPALGDTISITAPAGTFFTDASVLTLAGAEPVVVTRDAATMVFIPFPNIRDPAVVSNVGVASNPNLTFTLATPDTVITDSITTAGDNLTPTTPALGVPVTLVLPPTLRVIPESVLASLTVAGSEIAPLGVAVSPDSTTITFIPPPNADTTVEVPGVIAQRLPMYPLEVPTTVKVTTPVVDSVPSTLSTLAPAVNEEVTLTRTDAAFSFNPDAAVLVGAVPAVVTTVAGDGSSIGFVPGVGATGNVTVDGVAIAGFGLSLPAQQPSMTVSSTVPVLAGTGTPATAPLILAPGQFFDDAVFTSPDVTADGGVSAQYYRITVAVETTLTINISSSDAAPDLDGVICNDGTCADPNQQDFSLASLAHDESAEVTLPAGTHILAVVNFDGAPTDFINVQFVP